MSEAVTDLAGQLAFALADELASLQRGKAGVQLRSLRRRHQLCDRAAVEGATLDRGSVEDRALGRRQGVDARRKQRLDRLRRSCGDNSGLRASGHHLLEEERIALGRGEQHVALVGFESVPAEPLNERGSLVGPEGAQRHQRVARSELAPIRATLEQLRAGEEDGEQWHVRGGGRKVLDEVEQRRLGPVEVVDDDNKRTLLGLDLQQPPHRPVRLLDRDAAGREANGPRDAGGDSRALRAASGELGDGRLVGALGEPPDDLGQRPVGDPFAVGQAASHNRGGALGGLAEERPSEARLADARRPDQRDEPRSPRPDDGVKRVPEPAQLRAPADQRPRGSGSCARATTDVHLFQPPGIDELGLALQAQRCDRGQARAAPQQSGRRRADQDLARPRGRLQALCDVDRVSVRHRLARCAHARDDVAGVEAGVRAQADIPPRDQHLVERL